MSRSLQESSLLNTVDYRSLSVGSVPTSEYLISTTVVGATPVASVEFDVSSYAGVYRHLRVYISAKTTFGTEQLTQLNMQINGVDMTRYHNLVGTGSGAFSEDYTSSKIFLWVSGNNVASSAFGAAVVDILDPFETTKNTTAKSFSGAYGTSVYRVGLGSGFLNSASAVTSIKFLDRQGGTILTDSRFSIYGVTE